MIKRKETSVSWFNEPGGGIQYKFSTKIENLLNSGCLRIIDFTQLTFLSITRFSGRMMLNALE